MADIISKSSIPSAYTEYKVFDIDSGDGGSGDHYYYVAGNGVFLQQRLVKNWGSWGRSWNHEIFAYIPGEGFKSVYTYSNSAKQTESGTWNYYFSKNINGHSYSTVSGYDDTILWKIRVYFAELYHRYLWIGVTSAGDLTSSRGDVYPGKKILRCASPTNSPGSGFGYKIYSSGSSPNDSKALEYFRPSLYRGNPIGNNRSDCVYGYNF